MMCPYLLLIDIIKSNFNNILLYKYSWKVPNVYSCKVCVYVTTFFYFCACDSH